MDIIHSSNVARRLFEEGQDMDVVMAGFLHDAIEDGDLTYNQIAEFSPRTAILVLKVTRGSDEPYNEYIVRVGRNLDAIEIKLADLHDNLDRMDDEHESLRPRYENAIGTLERARVLLWAKG